ncbi:MAG TPA: Rrf2 family transcriptional regulator [Longimicrobiaceae bacterium]|nr:Rrf2 family transcriptional regulator [Longimicrobiaceae bacterium]
MITSERLPAALHVLLHMAEHPERPMTSAEMAACARTNPVVIRRTFAGLREAGIVSAARGHGGGWRLARPATSVSIAEIQRALGERVVSLAPAEDPPRCLLLRSVVRSLDAALREAEQVLDRRLSTLTLADLAADVARPQAGPGGAPHV